MTSITPIRREELTGLLAFANDEKALKGSLRYWLVAALVTIDQLLDSEKRELESLNG